MERIGKVPGKRKRGHRLPCTVIVRPRERGCSANGLGSSPGRSRAEVGTRAEGSGARRKW
jgi:hypothetical protein